MKPTKAFCIGAHKTGTSSLGEALASIGYRVFPENLWYRDPSLQQEFYAGKHSRLARLIEHYDAFEDSPFNHGDFFKWLYASYPHAKFVLTVRNTASALASHKRWLGELRPVLQRNAELNATVKLLYQHEYGQIEPINDEARLGRRYEARNQEVATFFRNKSDQLLILDLEQETSPWQRICGFLHEPVPWMTFPHLKRTH